MMDVKAYRRALGCFATGVAVITAESPDGVIGLTVNSFTSVSLAPPLVLWCLGIDSDRYAIYAGAPRWGVTVLESGQAAYSSRFAAGEPQMLSPSEIHRMADGAPGLIGGLAYFSARAYETRIVGDHLVIVGEVTAFESHEGAALTYFRSRYGRLEQGA